ncbi:uncharacterized protein LOC118461272 [Anopheles albimanus]|uniref:uncharacterized protein LOC118461272 n=1 Tax=Anopheles albimanus TaxID=7167 RepID=UPI00163DEC6D|nr:uncharacterized protein LOC118461272 [Anopheles albimanus]
MASKSSKVNFSEVLPDDEKIISRNLAWRKILERYSKAGNVDNDEGVLISDFVQHYPVSDDNLSDESSASDVCEDEGGLSDSSDDDLEQNKQQLAVAVKARTNQWKESGLEKIFKDNFTLGTKEAMDWLEHCKAGQGKAMARERETHFTEIDGDKTLDVSCKRNVSFLNQNGAQQLTSIDNSNIELKHATGKRIIFRQTERTLTTIFDESAGSTTDLYLPSSMLSFPNWSVNNIPSILQGLSASKPKPTRKVTFKPPKPLKNSNRKEPNDRLAQFRRPKMDKEFAPKQISQKKPKPIIISSSDSDSEKGDSLSVKVARKPVNQKRVTFKETEQLGKDLQNSPNNRSQPCKEIKMSKENLPKQVSKEHAKVVSISSSDSDDMGPPTTRSIRKPFDQKQTNALNPKPSTSCDGSRVQNFYKNCTSQEKTTESKSKSQQTRDSSSESKIDSQGKQQLKNSRDDKNSDDSGGKNKTAVDTALHKPTIKATRSSAKADPTENPQIAAPTDTKPDCDQHYYMTATMKEQLNIGGRFRYRMEGMVIYRPKKIKHDAPATERIRISRENLDLGAIEDEKKRQKFDNFLYSIHPNSTIVYYMSEDEEEPEAENDADGSESEDEDDPILKFRPKVCVFEIPYEGPSV